MKIGVSTGCFYPLETEKSLALLLSMGFRTFEIFLNADSEMKPAFLRELKAQLEDGGGRAVSVHPYTSAIEGTILFGGYPRRIEDGFELYRRYFETAAFLGAKYLVIHGQQKHGGVFTPEQEYWERFARLARLGREVGVAPAQENVVHYRGADPAFLRGMREYLGEEVSFVLDVKQLRLCGYALEEMLSAMGNRLCHVHLSDGAPGRSCLLPGEGEEDFSSLFSRLSAQGYRGDMSIEVYRQGFCQAEDLERARLYVEELLKN